MRRGKRLSGLITDHHVTEVRGGVYLGQYMEYLGVHQSSPVSVLGDTKNLCADLKRTQ